jgi:hypothetical protein
LSELLGYRLGCDTFGPSKCGPSVLVYLPELVRARVSRLALGPRVKMMGINPRCYLRLGP